MRTNKPMRVSGVATNGVYICYLASAPWNRGRVRERNASTRARVHPVGKPLFWSAMEVSASLGYDGRVGLHSKRLAEGRYKRMIPGIEDGLNDSGEGGLLWMEVGSLAARVFRRGVTCSPHGVYNIPQDE